MAAAADMFSQFAKNYVAITEALQREGVPEAVARIEARASSMDLLERALESNDTGLPCPTCGRA